MADSFDATVEKDVFHEVAEQRRLGIGEGALPWGFCRDGYTDILEWERARHARDMESQRQYEQQEQQQAEQEEERKREMEEQKMGKEDILSRLAGHAHLSRQARIFLKNEMKRELRERGRMANEDMREKWDIKILDMAGHEESAKERRKRKVVVISSSDEGEVLEAN